MANWIFSMGGWLISFMCFALLLSAFNKQQKKGNNVSLIRKVIACIVCCHVNGMLSILLYHPVMYVFDISTDGFMNLNGVITEMVIWMVIAIIMLVILSYSKERIADLYKTVQITQMVFFVLPIIILIVFFLAASFK